MVTVSQKYKDGIFRMLFAEKKDLLSLYNAVARANYTNIDDLEVNTLENVIYMSYKNDISFVIDGSLSLYEHQSTWCGNLPLRYLIYTSNLFSKITAKSNLHGSKTVSLPNPHYMVFYNGMNKLPDCSIHKLSDAYTTKEGDVLANFLRTHRSEGMNVSIFEYNAEQHIAMEKEESWNEGWNKGSSEGSIQKLVEHTGTGRISRMTMRPMSLFESKESNGNVSLMDLFNGETEIDAISDLSIEEISKSIVRGGWPASIDQGEKASYRHAIDYVEAIINHAISVIDNIQKKLQELDL